MLLLLLATELSAVFKQQESCSFKHRFILLGGFAIFGITNLIDHPAELRNNMEKVEDNLDIQTISPYEYQNGAQWDWFGGRMIYAMFENGFSELAKEKLIEIFSKNLANRGFFEWDNKEGIGQGSDFYCGSAGSLGKALLEGYFGIKLGRDYLNIEPKIGRDSAKIHVYQPANDIFVTYEYSFDESEGQLSLSYNSNFPHDGSLRILIPWLNKVDREERLKRNLEVQIDGKLTDFKLETINNDSFVVIDTDFDNHTARVFMNRLVH